MGSLLLLAMTDTSHPWACIVLLLVEGAVLRTQRWQHGASHSQVTSQYIYQQNTGTYMSLGMNPRTAHGLSGLCQHTVSMISKAHSRSGIEHTLRRSGPYTQQMRCGVGAGRNRVLGG